MSKDIQQHEKPLTIREKITIYMCFLVMKIVKPMEYSHDVDESMNQVMNEINKK